MLSANVANVNNLLPIHLNLTKNSTEVKNKNNFKIVLTFSWNSRWHTLSLYTLVTLAVDFEFFQHTFLRNMTNFVST